MLDLSVSLRRKYNWAICLLILISLWTLAYDPFFGQSHFWSPISPNLPEISFFALGTLILIGSLFPKTAILSVRLGVGQSITWFSWVIYRLGVLVTQKYATSTLIWFLCHLILWAIFTTYIVNRYLKEGQIGLQSSKSIRIGSLVGIPILIFTAIIYSFPFLKNIYKGMNGWNFKGSGTSTLITSCCYSAQSGVWQNIIDFSPYLTVLILLLFSTTGRSVSAALLVSPLLSISMKIPDILIKLGPQPASSSWSASDVKTYSLTYQIQGELAAYIFIGGVVLLIIVLLGAFKTFESQKPSILSPEEISIPGEPA